MVNGEHAREILYDASKEDFDSSPSKFHTAFPGGFPWEVLAVFSGPPRISFSWRHWASFDGTYLDREGDNKTFELYGFGSLDVTEDLKVKNIEIFYKPDEFLKALHRDIPAEALSNGKSLVGTGCPVLTANKQNRSKFFCF